MSAMYAADPPESEISRPSARRRAMPIAASCQAGWATQRIGSPAPRSKVSVVVLIRDPATRFSAHLIGLAVRTIGAVRANVVGEAGVAPPTAETNLALEDL